MSREIKFRAWCVKEKRMIYLANSQMSSTFLQLNNHSWGVFEPDKEDYCGGCTCNSNTGDILMQYTGLKDKNGKEIYEGDIVKQHGYTDYDNYFSVSEFVGIVIYEDCGFAVRHFDKEDKARRYITPFFMEISEYPESIKHYEVIGNIWENPELLKESENIGK